MRAAFGLLLVASMLASGCVGGQSAALPAGTGPAGSTGPVDSEHGGVTGTVTDDSLAPLAGVSIGSVAAGDGIGVVTDETGHFTLGGLSPGPQAIAAQKLGYNSAAKSVNIAAGETVSVQFTLTALPVAGEARHQTLIGNGFFACGADTPVVTWGNLAVCVWSEHHPNFSFMAPKADLKAILLEVAWNPNSGVTSHTLEVSLQYQQVCDPFCNSAGQWGKNVSTSPVRSYIPIKPVTQKVKEDPMPLKSVTFPNRGSDPVVVVYQQRMTHYVTLFFNQDCTPTGEECPMSAFTAVPDK